MYKKNLLIKLFLFLNKEITLKTLKGFTIYFNSLIILKRKDVI